MKFSELWLHEWIKPNLSREELCTRLTMAGLEVESLTPAAEKISNVIVGKIISVEKHPTADRLHICRVEIKKEKFITVVCGAENARAGLKAPLALSGAVLPKVTVSANKIRGIDSEGMLCSLHDLGLTEDNSGLFELPEEAELGKDISELLNLNDFILDIAVTPNRGDCLSVMGMAKEISALTQSKIKLPAFSPVPSTIKDSLKITVQASADCARYVGRIIKNITADAKTPLWMQERLRRSDVRCISPVVDVMNYVMLELGQPMHAFDLNTITQEIIVRKAKKAEKLALLDGQTVELSDNTLVIADHDKTLAIAGVMGGIESSVTLLTKNIFLESAFFSPKTIAETVRQYGINSDSSYRFERGVDPDLQKKAIERATELLLEIVGGEVGPIIEVTDQQYLPKISVIHLRRDRIKKILGMNVPESSVKDILNRLGFSLKEIKDGWQVTVPTARTDVTLEVDLIEEIGRLYGYDKLPEEHSSAVLTIHAQPENKLSVGALRQALCSSGYQEVITYSFVSEKMQTLLNPAHQAKKLLNPITADMTIMRTNLWPGLVNTLLYNQNRQQTRVRLFETGLRFIETNKSLLQERVISGLVCGSHLPEQWGNANRQVDFFDLKGDLQNLFQLTLSSNEFIFKPATHPALHPSQTAEIFRRGQLIGILGALHPSVMQTLGLEQKVFVFELLLDPLEEANIPKVFPISKFPEIRRDIAIIVDQKIPAEQIQKTVKEVAGDLLKDSNLFDVYQGKGIALDKKSIAISLTLQDYSRTLIDEEVADIVERVIVALRERFAAELRG